MVKIGKIFNKEKGKPLKRVELKASALKSKLKGRLSRTGGANAAFSPIRGITLNTKHGLRLSKTYKGFTFGFQNKNSIIRGRWKLSDAFNLNLSKSGFSFSAKSDYGSFNFRNPNRSSFKLFGIQLRGKKAKNLAFISIIPALIGAIFKIINFLLKPVIFILKPFVWVFIFFFKILFFLFKEILLFIYNLICFLVIDLPKIGINSLFQKEIFRIYTPDLKKITKNQIVSKDKDVLDLLKERLEFYKEFYPKITYINGLLSRIKGVLGILMYSLCLFLPLFALNSSVNLIVFLYILPIVIGTELRESIVILKRRKEDLELAKIINYKF
tara:strand:- start:1636 stop:2616 length:981 start_codon:yes stop_codon:yes gene_type:complete